MRPKTKLQKCVVELSESVGNVDTMLSNWAKDKLVPKIGFQTKKKVECLECGNSFSPTIVKRKRAICPHCNSKLKVEVTQKRINNIEMPLAYAETGYYDYATDQEFQLIRYYDFKSYHKVGYKSKYYLKEVLQHWILPDGKCETIARLINSWSGSFSGPMEIRKDGYWKKYDVYTDNFHPQSTFQDKYRFYGIDADFKGLTFKKAITVLPNNNKAETLLKIKQYEMFSHCEDINIHIFWHCIMIAFKHRYKITDIKMWFDYLELLKFFGKDLRNPHYICPKNLKQAHDTWVNKKRKRDAMLEEERKRKEAIENEELFLKLKSKFFGIAFSNKTIEVRVLESVLDVMKEGDVLHHCVFTNGYYKREDSLILSASVNGKKTETVEVSLSKMEVVQCRGLQNKNSEYHEAIVKLVNQNMGIIKRRMLIKKKSSVKRTKPTTLGRMLWMKKNTIDC